MVARTPQARALICPADANGAPACGAPLRLAAFDRWIQGALSRPGSTFSLWRAGADRESSGRLTLVCVPERWGVGVLGAKAEFVARARKALDQGTPLSPGSCGGLEESSGTAELLSGDSVRFNVADAPSAVPLESAVICDRSTSTLGRACSASEVLAAYDHWVPMAVTTPGSSFTVYLAGRSRDGTVRAFAVTVPPRPLGDRLAFVIGARGEIGGAVGRGPDGSAIAEALSVAATGLRRRSGHAEIRLLSDLREVSGDRWDFERAVPGPDEFVRWLRERDLLPNLAGVEVHVCGLHSGRGPGAPAFDASMDSAVERDWRRALGAMGVRAPDLRGDCDGA